MKPDGVHIEGDISCGRDGAGTSGGGVLRLEDGELYVDEVRLTEHLKQFVGKFCEFAFFFPVDVPDGYHGFDEKIAPLVKALNDKGVRTFSSCEGHMDIRQLMLVRRPYVWVMLQDYRKVFHTVPSGWELSHSDVSSEQPEACAKLASFQTIQVAETQQELEGLQRQAIALAAQIR